MIDLFLLFDPLVNFNSSLTNFALHSLFPDSPLPLWEIILFSNFSGIVLQMKKPIFLSYKHSSLLFSFFLLDPISWIPIVHFEYQVINFIPLIVVLIWPLIWLKITQLQTIHCLCLGNMRVMKNASLNIVIFDLIHSIDMVHVEIKCSCFTLLHCAS